MWRLKPPHKVKVKINNAHNHTRRRPDFACGDMRRIFLCLRYQVFAP
ncbi:MAG: hypothetical protein LBH93_03735 [Chitinispirillales bacterium]|nr:hypothetical protein [Chitinispirillales bacterium]